MTNLQLNALLEAFAEPAQIIDGMGAVVAHNRAGAAWDGKDGVPERMVALGDGWQLRRLTNPRSDIQALAGGIAHEIRNPLAAILTAAKLINDDREVSEETATLIGVIKKESLRMNRIVSEFSAYVRPGTVQLAEFDCARALRRTVEILRRDGAIGEEVTVIDSLPEQLMVSADETRIENAFQRIAANALEAMRGHGQLHLEGRIREGTVQICISDSGPGFSKEGLQRALLPFYSKNPQGTGLGLAIANSAVMAAGGKLWLENQDETAGGARVCLELPGREVPALGGPPCRARNNDALEIQ